MKQYFKTVAKRIWADVRKYALAVFMYLIYYFTTLIIFHASCPMILLTGMPCPGCGMNRALLSIVTFRWGNAFYLNPVSFGWAVLIILVIVFRYFLGKTPKFLTVIFWVLIALLFVRYFYGLFHWFPNRIPYVYRRNNLLRYLIHH